MSTYKAPLTDIRFALYDVLGADTLFAKLGYTDATREQDGADDGRRTQLQVRAVGWRHGWARVS